MLQLAVLRQAAPRRLQACGADRRLGVLRSHVRAGWRKAVPIAATRDLVAWHRRFLA